MIFEIECEHNFLEYDYSRITMNTLIDFKQTLNFVLLRINQWKHSPYDGDSKFTNYTDITNSAYGLMLNPYRNVEKYINDMKYRLEKISEEISESFILDNVEFINTDQTFNDKFILIRPEYGQITTYEEAKKDWLDIVYNFDSAIKLYNESSNNRNEILVKSLKMPLTEEKVNGYYYYLDKPRNELNVCEQILYTKNGKLSVTIYALGQSDWAVYSHRLTRKFDSNNKKYEFIWKTECPELYLIDNIDN